MRRAAGGGCRVGDTGPVNSGTPEGAVDAGAAGATLGAARGAEGGLPPAPGGVAKERTMPTEPEQGRTRGTGTGGPQPTRATTPGTGTKTGTGTETGTGQGTEAEVEGYLLGQQAEGDQAAMPDAQGKMAARQAIPCDQMDQADR